MKLFIKRNKITIIVFLFLVSWALFDVLEYLKMFNNQLEVYNMVMKQMKEGIINYRYFPEPTIPDTVLVYFQLIWDYSLMYFQLIAPIVIVIPALWGFNKELKTGYFKNFLTRMSYRDYMKKIMVSIYKNALILPAFATVIFLLAYLLSGNFDYEKTKLMNAGMLLIDEKYLAILPQFIATYLLVLTLHGVFYINLGLIFLKKNMNFMVTVIASYLTFYVVEIFMLVVVSGLILARVFNIHNVSASLNLFNIWNYSEIISLPFVIIYALILALSSSIVVFFIYRNKEGLIIDNEK